MSTDLEKEFMNLNFKNKNLCNKKKWCLTKILRLIFLIIIDLGLSAIYHITRKKSFQLEGWNVNDKFLWFLFG